MSQNPQVAELRILKSVSASASVLRVTGSVRRRRCMHCGRARSVDQVRAQLVEQPILHRGPQVPTFAIGHGERTPWPSLRRASDTTFASRRGRRGAVDLVRVLRPGVFST